MLDSFFSNRSKTIIHHHYGTDLILNSAKEGDTDMEDGSILCLTYVKTSPWGDYIRTLLKRHKMTV